MLQAIDPRLHQFAIVVEQRGLVERALLVRHGGDPVGAILCEQSHPVAKAARIEELRLMNQKQLERSAVDARDATKLDRAPARAIHHAASRM